MGLRDMLRRSDQAEDRALTKQSVPPVMLSSPPAGSVTPNTALQVADAYACVRALADAAASLPLHVYRRTDSGRERVEGRTAELLRNPAPAMTTANLVGQLVAHLNLYGNAYLGKFRDADGRLSQLSLLAPERVVPEIRAGRPLYTLTGIDGRQTRHGSDDVIHVKALTTDGLVGLSPVRQCRAALGLSDQLTQHASTFFQNDARPAGVLRLNRFGDVDQQVSDLRDAWSAQHGGTENAHKIAVVAGDVDFTAISMPLDDAQFLEQRKLSAVEIARLFRIPPHLIGADPGESLTYSNVESQALDFARYSLRPWLVTIEQALSADRDLFPASHYAEFQMDALLRADSKTRAEVYTRALDPITGWLTRDEVRKLENLEPEPSPPPPERVVAEALAAGSGNGAS